MEVAKKIHQLMTTESELEYTTQYIKSQIDALIMAECLSQHSQSELARRCGVNRSFISNIKSGRKRMPDNVRATLIKIL